MTPTEDTPGTAGILPARTPPESRHANSRQPAQQAQTPRDHAIAQQLEASDPAVSAFVTASAGSGKTKLLTDRMLRLMLGGAHPGRIQCLTFTKAAAAEMALRLQHRLGLWVTLDDAALDRELRLLEVAPTPAARQQARALFADVLDLPGGMRIGTIHAFCQSLLRRFPLEAEVSPHFALVEEAEAEAEMLAAREDVLAAADGADVAIVAGLVRADVFADLVHAMQAQRGRLAGLMAQPEPARESLVWTAAGARHASDEEAVADGVCWPGEHEIEAALWKLQAEGSPEARVRALQMISWLALPPAERTAHWASWLAEFFNDKAEPKLWGKFPNPNLHKAHPWIRTALEAEQQRVSAVEDTRRAIRCATATCALLRLVAPALDAYKAAKARAGLLDYTDLIEETEQLLLKPGAAWVLYKLDGGIDHLLLDEVQDTAPEQWRIADRLTEEFFAGQGTQDAGQRTFFAVGDPKQSIYSFQGADPLEFRRSQERMARRVGGSGQTWRDVTLEVSFRSTTPVLALVDAVFAGPDAAKGVVPPGDELHHLADRAHAAGRVELWPLAPPPSTEKPKPWTVPPVNHGLTSGPQNLADGIATAIEEMLARGERLESRGRPLAPGDILVLVRRRTAFATGLVRALKARGVPVAGLDRLRLTEQAAVQDLLSACDAVLLPEDDLSVACVLTSPLGGLSDQALMDLALGRHGTLSETLARRATERPDWTAAWAFLRALSARVDYVTPHALLAEALGPLGGRARLLARLGAEAAEPIQELLGAALAYTRLHAPSLQGFLHWIRRSGAEVKREAGGAGSMVRVMTAHGAKGLQAPVVILPDTAGLPPQRDVVVWTKVAEPGRPGATIEVPLWAPLKPLKCSAWQTAVDAVRKAAMEEYNRLLYVALTRAEDRLLVCGWAPKAGAAPPDSWYEMTRRGFERMGATPVPFAGPWGGETLMAESVQAGPVAAPRPPPASDARALPRWAGRPGAWQAARLPDEPALPRPLAPSRPIGALFGPVPAATSPLAVLAGSQPGSQAGSHPGGPRYARGAAVHELLQHLPAVPEAGRRAAGTAWLAQTVLDPAARTELLDQVLAVLELPALQPLFAPNARAEQPVSGLVAGQVVSGIVDRMALLPGAVLIADFKTGRTAPADVEATPARYLRQLAAYRAVLRGVFPGRAVHCWLVWTEGAVAVPLPDTLLDRFAPGA